MTEEKEVKKEVNVESVSIEDPKQQTNLDNNSEIIEQLNDKIAELNDKYLRIAAELENTRRRATLDIESVSRNRAMGVAEKILPVMDAVDSALKHSPDDEGIKTMQRALQNAFAQIGIVKIDSVGQKLNPTFHNAIQIIDKPDDKTESNIIVEELQPGYMFGDTVMRPAMVIVSK